MPSREELKMLQALPLDVKVAKTKLRIKEFVEHYGEDDCYISFSGGKDSTVLLDIVRSIYPNMLAIFSDTGLEYPEIKEFVKTFDNTQIVRPEMNFRQVIEKYGYPLLSKPVSMKAYRIRTKKTEGISAYIKYFDGSEKGSKYSCPKYKPILHAPFMISHMCCDVMKKNPLHKIDKKPLIATMTHESVVRERKWFENGCNSFNGTEHSLPMSFWTEQDVLQYIKQNNLKVCSVYGDLVSDEDFEYFDYFEVFNNDAQELHFTGCKRTGCVFCGFGAHLEKGKSRFELLKETHPKLYNYCINGGTFDENGLWKPTNDGLGMGFVFDWCNENINNFEIRY